jgi:hypothetical protein
MSNVTVGLPETMALAVEQRMAGDTSPLSLERIFGADRSAEIKELQRNGAAVFRDRTGNEVVVTASFDNSGNVMDVAAAIPRKSGSAVNFLNQIDDFNEVGNLTNADRKTRVALFHRLYAADGVTNNAVSKLSALIAPKGKYKVKAVRGQQGRRGDQAKTRALSIVNWWKDKVNSNSIDAVMTGSRGVQTWVRRGSRLALIEGDHFGRKLWKSVTVPKVGKVDLPMNLQTYSSQYIDPVEGIEITDLELYYWKPPSKFIQQLRKSTDPNLQKYIDGYIPPAVRQELIKKQRYLLDPSLMTHVKNQGTDISQFGESLIGPSLPDIRYKRALDALELTVITNIMARVVIIKIGSDNPESSYHAANVTQSRLGVLQRAFQTTGPNATLLWGGPDINVLEVSAHNALLELVPRYQLAERRQLMALGVPVVLMIGEGSGGKAVSYASALAAVSRCQELQDQYKALLTQIGEEILVENNFSDVEIEWEWEQNILDDPEAAANLLLKMYQLGLTTPESTLEGVGMNYEAELERQQSAVDEGLKGEVFGPPKAALTTNPNGINPDNTSGRPGDSTERDPRTNRETRAREPNR